MPRIPRTSARNKTNTFGILLYRVDPRNNYGFGFEGTFVKPGAEVHNLCPGPEYPSRAVLLEYAGTTGLTASGQRAWGHNRAEGLYILWTFDNGCWHELGRAQSVSWEWACDLRPLAVRALRDARGPDMQVLPSLEVVTLRLRELIEGEMVRLEPSDRGKVLGILHDQFASRLAELSG